MAKKPRTPEREETFHILDSAHTDPARLKREREKARALRKTQWWLDRLNRGVCHYCGGRFPPEKLTMDHLIPLARGGTSTQGNIVPACKDCNTAKGLDTPVDELFRKLESERGSGSTGDES
jgi:5-methylcytosine-specific restriction protein A